MIQKSIFIICSLSFLLLLVSCSENIVSECETDIKDDDTTGNENVVRAQFSDIQEKVFTPTCATSGCHNGVQEPDLREGMSYDNLVGVKAIGNPSMNRVEPGDSGNSYLIKKLLGDDTALMPQGGPPLESEVIDSIRTWIDNGAEKN